MPAATQYWDTANPLNTYDRSLKDSAETERRNRVKLYETNCKQYDGDHKKFLKLREAQVDPNVVINLDGEAIDARNNFNFGQMFTLQLDEETEESDVEQSVLDVFDDNGAESFLQDCGLFGELSGHVYVRVYSDAYQVNEDNITFTADMPVVLVAMNPAQIITYWAAHDKRTVMWHEQRYEADRKYKIDYINMDATFGTAGWEIRTYAMQGNGWLLIERKTWPLPFPPVVDWQHIRDPRSYYGRPSLSPTRINDSVNKVASDIKQILRYHAAPRTVGKGFKTKDVDTSIDGIITIPAGNSDAPTDVFNLEMQSDLASSMNYFNILRESHAREMKVVKIAGGAEAFKGITNLGLKVAFADMLADSNNIHRNYNVGIRTLVLCIMALQGTSTDGVKPKITWPSALPMSELEETQTMQLQHDMGVRSKESIASRLGIDWTEEEKRLASEGEDEQAQADALGQLMGRAQQGQPNGNGNGNGGAQFGGRDVK